MATKTTAYIPESGIVKQGNDYKVSVTITTKSGANYPLNGVIKHDDYKDLVGADDAAKITARLKEIGAEKEASEAAAKDAAVTLFDDTTITL